MAAPPAEPPVEVGAPLSKATVNAQVGTAAQSFKRGLDELVTAHEWQLGYDVPRLIALGFTEQEANVLKSALNDVPAIDAAVTAAQWLSRLWGTGI